MTDAEAKARVLERYPNARAWEAMSGGWIVDKDGGSVTISLASGETESEAWLAAARSLENSDANR